MFNYLEKFNSLPQELRNKVSTPKVVASINELEKKYGIKLAAIIMRVMTKELDINNLVSFLRQEFDMETSQANLLVTDLKLKIFKNVRDYLGFVLPKVNSGDVANKRKNSGGSEFFFSPDDEDDIKKQKEKIADFGNMKEKSDEIDRRSEEIANEFNINFSSQDLKNRFNKIIRTYIRNVRSRIDTKHTLTKSVSEGGVGLDENQADWVIAAATKLKFDISTHNIKPPEKIKLSTEELNTEKNDKQKSLRDSGVRDVDYDFSSLIKKKLDTKHELAPPPPAVVRDFFKENDSLKKINLNISSVKNKIKDAIPNYKEKRKRIAESKIRKEKEEIEKIKEKFNSAPEKIIHQRKSSKSNGKSKVSDVEHSPLIMSPIDELRYMNLKNFRRLGAKNKTPRKKIEEIIKLLAKDGLSKKISGIKAWRQSPVNKMYLSLGKESISQKRPVSVIIEEKASSGEDVLSFEEFKEIMAINKTLNY